ncbi:pentatricopeptide repeat-containing protein At3g12770 [Selaginella moellendorffii]|uniref:pentatricopeptide repeat-containing protein At3g12770 n=1 Tax=Selaginella moellendorffii TaxID=88036 RepID=UPI000D1CA46D|nr:pentatricopeptide repeat-containing protein At3g12770 [Selaginella moellendorffii]|eukprot:XP_024529386.1 pentatricopeptide repeat-containing protein At3g12770 [Selaginella moellendorffii]
MYGRCGDIASAREIFDSMPRRNRFSWSIMIGAYAQTGHGRDALELFQRMGREGVRPSSVTFVVLLSVCADLGGAALGEGRAIHAKIIADGLAADPILCNNLVNMYGKCGSLRDAKEIFESFSSGRDVVAWTAMIQAYAQLGHSAAALELFWAVVEAGEARPNRVTFITALGACSNLHDLEEGRKIHRYIDRYEEEEERSDVLVATALINMYGKCGSVEDAREIFQGISKRDVIAWNAIIAANAQLGHGKEALELLQRMDLEGVRPNQVSFVSALDGCASIGALAEGRSIHARVRASRSLASTTLGNTLIHMYGKCGSLAGARVAFEEMGGAAAPRDAVSWAALVAAYARHGRSRAAREVFERMAWEGVQPSGVAFVSILAACSHGGLLLPSRSYFLAMSGDHGIAPSMEHYGCVIDLLGRLGMMEELMDLIAAMPFEPGGIEWRNVLGACRTQSDVENGSDAAEIARELEPEHAAAYVMLFGLYSTEEP